MEEGAVQTLVMQFAAGFAASLLVLRRAAGPLASVLLGACGTAIGGVLAPRWLTGPIDGDLRLAITSILGALVAAWLMRLAILRALRRSAGT